MTKHIEDEDQKMIERIKAEMRVFVREEGQKQQKWMDDKFARSLLDVTDKVKYVQNLVGSKAQDQDSYFSGLKQEIEGMQEYVRSQNLENLTVIKSMTMTLKGMKETYLK